MPLCFIPYSLLFSLSQLEKTEAPAPRFRRKHRQHESASSSSSTSEGSTNSSHSSRRRTDNLYDGLLEEEPIVHIQNSNHTLKSITFNGCDTLQTCATISPSGLDENEADTVDMQKTRPLANDASVVPQNGCSDITVLQLPSKLEDLPHSNIISLTSDPHLSISCCRVYKDDALLLVLFICNTTEMPIHNVTVELSCEELEVSII